MFIWQEIIVAMFVTISMSAFSAHMFRFSFWKHKGSFLFAAFTMAQLSYEFHNILNWDSVFPLVSLAVQSVFTNIILKVGKLRALMMVLIGMLVYTVLLSLVIMMVRHLSDVGYEAIVIHLEYENLIKCITGAILGLAALVMSKYRLGFSWVSQNKGYRYHRKLQGYFSIVLALSLFFFSISYYLVTLNLSYLAGVIFCLCISLATMIYFLMKKEWEEET